MSSRVIVTKLPHTFQQINNNHQTIKVSLDLPVFLGLTSTDPVIRVNQLEQTIRFLQEQHQIMLTGLHDEIESLRQKNRDLQFQIIFSKEVTLVQNKPSSDDESQKKVDFSSNQVNMTPVQLDILEQNVAELHTNLSRAKTRNVYLQNVIDEQKKKISALQNEKLDWITLGRRFGKENVSKTKPEVQEVNVEELQEKLEHADRLIRRLKRENEEQRKEIVCLRTSLNKNKVENRRNDGNNSHRNYYRNGQSQNSRFPPLHSHPHWKNSLEHQGNQNSERGGNRLNKDSETAGRTAPSLPYLRDRNNASTSTGYSNPAYNNYQGVNHKRGFNYHRKQEEHRSNGRLSRKDQAQQPDTER